MRRRNWPAALAALALLPAATAAQSLALEPPPLRPTAQTGPTDPTARTALGATVGWVAGAGAGGLLGFALADSEYDDWVGALGAVLGAAVGSTLGATVGAHWSNEKRGDAVATFLSTAAATGLLLVAADRSTADVPLVVIPVGQILTAVLVERGTSGGRP